MMRKLLFSPLAIVIFLLSCEKNDIISDNQNLISLNVSIDNVTTKSIINDIDGKFEWTPNDFIGVYGKLTDNTCFRFDAQSDGTATFIGHLDYIDDTLSYAYYPYCNNAQLLDNQFEFLIPDEIKLSNEGHAPMFGIVTDDKSIKFKYLGGILSMKIVCPSFYLGKVSIESEGSTSPFISGKAVVNDITSDNCEYRIEDGSSIITYRIGSSDDELFDYMCNIYNVFVPLQTGHYEKLYIRIYDDADNLIEEKSLSNLNIERSKLISTPVIHCTEKRYSFILPDSILNQSEWSEGIYFSNNLLLLKKRNNEFNEYSFTDISKLNSSQSSIFVLTDLNDRIIELYVNNSIYRFDYHDDSEYFNLIVTNSYGVSKTFKYPLEKIANSSVQTKLIESQTSNVILGLNRILRGDFINNNDRDNSPSQLIEEINPNDVMTGIAQNYYAIGYRANPLASIEVATSVIYSEYTTITKYRYRSVLGDTYMTLNDVSISDDDNLIVNYSIFVDNSVPQYPEDEAIRCKLLVLEVPEYSSDVNQIYANTPGVVEYDLPYGDFKTGNKMVFNNILIRNGYKYFVRALIGPEYYDINFYTEVLKVRKDVISIEDVQVTPLGYFNGYFNFNIAYVFNCISESRQYCAGVRETSIEQKVYGYFTWNKSELSAFKRMSIPKSMVDYDNRFIKGDWELVCAFNYDDLYDFGKSETIYPINFILDYDEEPYIKMDVSIVEGPKKIVTKASEGADKELYYLKYKVTVNAHGCGFISSINTYSTDGSFIKMEEKSLKESNETFEYTGAVVYSDSNKLPSIICKGELINREKLNEDIVIKLSDLL